jgi:hypothetical protein
MVNSKRQPVNSSLFNAHEYLKEQLTDHEEKEHKMNTKWNFLIVLVLLATLVGGSASPAQAQGGITGISPAEGTVGTQVTITGAGFGDKLGGVLLGTEKSKVLSWSDTQITFMVDKPQRSNEYAITVLLQGDKKTAEPMTFEAFAMRRPRITSGDLLLDGAVATVVGAFFGDKKGALRLGYLEGGAEGNLVVQDPKILDWSMNTIRFELPEGLPGQFILAVSSEVGPGLALMHLDGGMPGQIPHPPGLEGGETYDIANGVYYKGKFYVFSNNSNPGYDDNYLIKAYTFDPQTGNLNRLSIPHAKTEVSIQPLVIGNTLWVFYSGYNWAENVCCEPIWYGKYTYNEATQTGTWDPANGWNEVGIAEIDEDNTLAPVYDLRNNRISVYYQNGKKLRWFYSDDLGNTWHDDALVGTGIPIDTSSVHAIYWPSATTTALVAYSGHVIAVNNGEYRGYIGHLPSVGTHPSLVDLGGETALLYGGTPRMITLNYGNGAWSWSEPRQLVTLPDTGLPLSKYSFDFSPRGAINQIGNDRHLYLFYGAGLCIEECQHRWYLYDEETLGPVTPPPSILPTAFKQVTAGETHACAIKPDNTVECWGNSKDGKLDPPSGTFSQIDAGNFFTCGVKTDKSIACWGLNDYGQISERPTDKKYIQVAAGKQMACALTDTHSVVCWGDDADGKTQPYPYHYTQITAGSWHTCGLIEQPEFPNPRYPATVMCWGKEDNGRTATQTLPFVQISSAAWHNCGVLNNGAVYCWGDNDQNRMSPVPSGTYTEVTTGSWHSCGIKTDGSIACWGNNDDNRVSDRPKTGIFTQIDASIRYTCARRNDGGIVCWGLNSDSQSNPPF